MKPTIIHNKYKLKSKCGVMIIMMFEYVDVVVCGTGAGIKHLVSVLHG